jgi:hypothetical protein
MLDEVGAETYACAQWMSVGFMDAPVLIITILASASGRNVPAAPTFKVTGAGTHRV